MKPHKWQNGMSRVCGRRESSQIHRCSLIDHAQQFLRSKVPPQTHHACSIYLNRPEEVIFVCNLTEILISNLNLPQLTADFVSALQYQISSNLALIACRNATANS